MENSQFLAFGLSEEILAALSDLGFKEPTPIQTEVIPKLLKGYDLIAEAKTGTGKTASFGLPAISMVDPEDPQVQILIVCPTRELCLQIAEDFHSYLKYSQGIRVLPLYGGIPIDRQIKTMRGAQIIVATPGRLIDHLRRHSLRLNSVQMVVLDEADEMFNMGFRDDIDLILAACPQPRQTALFSATMPDEITKLCEHYMEDPVRVNTITDNNRTPVEISEYYTPLKSKMKDEAVRRFIVTQKPNRALVFVNTKKNAQDLSARLNINGFSVSALHGDLKQQERDFVMRRFRNGSINVLIATDLAARGLDVDDIQLIINYDIPDDNETYVHRIGRTARAGKLGTAVTFTVGREESRIEEIMAFTGKKILHRALPTLNELEEFEKADIISEIKNNINFGVSQKYRRDIDTLIAEGLDARDIATALLTKLLYKEAPVTLETEGDPELLNADPTGKKSRLPSFDNRKGNADSAVLFFNVGNAERIKVKDLVGAIAGECGISGSELGKITVLEHFSFVEVPAAYVKDILTTMNGVKIKEKKVRVEIAEGENGKQ